MITSIANRIVKPQQCVLAFGIPTSRKAFEASLSSPANRDFVVNVCPYWRQYLREIIRPFRSTVPSMRWLGIRVVLDLSLTDLGRLLHQQSPDVVILFTHWTGDKLEFSDGLADAEAVVEQIPPDREAIIDLCACRAVELALAIRNTRPACLTRFADLTATPLYWLYFYLTVVSILSKADMSYPDAFLEAVRTFDDGTGVGEAHGSHT